MAQTKKEYNRQLEEAKEIRSNYPDGIYYSHDQTKDKHFTTKKKLSTHFNLDNLPKPGDTVICKDGFINRPGYKDHGGSGYEAGKIFEVRSVEFEDQPFNPIVFPKGRSAGVYYYVLEPNT